LFAKYVNTFCFTALRRTLRLLQAKVPQVQTCSAMKIEQRVVARFSWRREQDSNLRLPCDNTRFPSVRLQPLGHLSVSLFILTDIVFAKKRAPIAGTFLIFFKNGKSPRAEKGFPSCPRAAYYNARCEASRTKPN
jgi:hypothetical protein